MREIKFRVWHKLDKKMIYEGWNDYVFISKNEIFQFGESGIMMQYTGFKDRNDEEIYDGDVMGDGVIIWDDWEGAFILEGKDWKQNMNYASLNLIVSGNIYDNTKTT